MPGLHPRASLPTHSAPSCLGKHGAQEHSTGAGIPGRAAGADAVGKREGLEPSRLLLVSSCGCPSACVCVLISSYKDPSQIALGPTPMISLP